MVLQDVLLEITMSQECMSNSQNYFPDTLQALNLGIIRGM